jgi:hypothetical protein
VIKRTGKKTIERFSRPGPSRGDKPTMNSLFRYFRFRATTAVLLVVLTIAARANAQNDPLPYWNDGLAKQAIIKSVTATTTEGNPDFVPPGARFATFDQDGTLWAEHPIYTQLVFAVDRVVALALEHPEWRTTEPFKSLSPTTRPRWQSSRSATWKDRLRDSYRHDGRRV